MKMVKNIAIVAFATSFMFAGVGFHYANNYTAMDTGTNVETSWGVSYDLNDNTSVGWDSDLGMLMYFDAPAGVTLRLGWTAGADASCSTAWDDGAGDAWDGTEGDCNLGENGADNAGGGDDGVFSAELFAETAVGLGFTWWTGGEGLQTSISTNYDYIMSPGAAAENFSNLSVVVGFGF